MSVAYFPASFHSAALLVLIALAPGCTPPGAGRGATVSGTIECDEVRVGSRYGGRVVRLHAQEGDSLSTGQLIAELDAEELSARRDHAAGILAELEAGARKEEIDAAKHSWEALAADLAYARNELNRAQELRAQNTISAAELDRAVARATSAEQNVAAARSQYDLLLAGTRPERLVQARAQLAELDAQLRECRITAPTNCAIESLHVRPGDVVPPNAPVATLLLADPLWTRAFVPEPWMAHVKVGGRVTLTVPAFPERLIEGRIEQIARRAEFTPRNVQTVEERVRQVFRVKIRIVNPGGDLRAGMTADVLFEGVPGP